MYFSDKIIDMDQLSYWSDIELLIFNKIRCDSTLCIMFHYHQNMLISHKNWLNNIEERSDAYFANAFWDDHYKYETYIEKIRLTNGQLYLLNMFKLMLSL
jgi:hypothetical protein